MGRTRRNATYLVRPVSAVILSVQLCFRHFFINGFSVYEPNILNNHICDSLANVTTERIEDANDENVQRTIYTELKQELREKEEVISTLNHKIAYLESSMKLKDLRISSLAAQILQNAVEMDKSAKSQSIDGTRTKLRSRSHNFHEAKTN
ncbi:hypothetical protein ALC53_06842 [Atta colombica]|uniref:Uncharacterized protein n=1 Tax=Atta colombica TaxID=520822 RepID=A0A195BEQ4_9HYME|nr:hypothetical protein ALC53_06842 [Atta colombica]